MSEIADKIIKMFNVKSDFIESTRKNINTMISQCDHENDLMEAVILYIEKNRKPFFPNFQSSWQHWRDLAKIPKDKGYSEIYKMFKQLENDLNVAYEFKTKKKQNIVIDINDNRLKNYGVMCSDLLNRNIKIEGIGLLDLFIIYQIIADLIITGGFKIDDLKSEIIIDAIPVFLKSNLEFKNKLSKLEARK